MNQDAYYKANAIMSEVEKLTKLKKFDFPPECYSISFKLSSGGSVGATCSDVGGHGMTKLINTYSEIIDNLINIQLQRLEEL